MRPTLKFWQVFFLLPFLFVSANAQTENNDDDAPDVTARVARISFLSGDAQIKRADSQDWERATQNLPIVEGDEIATEANARLEIQFDSENYLRLSENAYLKIATLRDEGAAVSLPNGSLSLRTLNFDKSRAYFEIDAPQITVSIEKTGTYRVDAGNKNDSNVRVSVTDSGQAHIYSENSGFTLKNGRSATIQIDGNYAGESEIVDAANFADDFDSWTLQRDAIIAKRLQNADYDKYYDRDIYGAEDLNDFGDWVYTKKYGYVWRPNRTSISSYTDWSPYRYGSWRWVAPYGWTWVNDEPWGWATYHHGRWVYDNDDWYWSPYSQNRSRRSWWHPALVVVSYIGSNICWYPLPYNYGYYNYNYSTYVDRRRYNTTIIRNTTIINPPNPSPHPSPSPTINPNAAPLPSIGTATLPKGRSIKMLPSSLIPPTGVISVDASNFGRVKSGFRLASPEVAKKILSETPSENVKPPVLPTFKDLNGKISKDILVENPSSEKSPARIRTGAAIRTNGSSMDENLRKERIWGNRTPIDKTLKPAMNDDSETSSPIRNTGAVKRQPRSNFPSSDETPVKPAPLQDSLPNSPGEVRNDDREIKPPTKPNRNNGREKVPAADNSPRDDRIQEPIRSPKIPRREERQEPVKQPEPTRPEKPPRREEPVRIPQPSPKPAPKQEPKPERLPEPSRIEKKVEKDG